MSCKYLKKISHLYEYEGFSFCSFNDEKIKCLMSDQNSYERTHIPADLAIYYLSVLAIVFHFKFDLVTIALAYTLCCRGLFTDSNVKFQNVEQTNLKCCLCLL